MVRVLVEAGADVNVRSTVVTWERQRSAEPRDKWLPPGGFTALLLAGRAGCVDCVKALASSGANINEIDPESHTALVLALMNGQFDAAGALIEAGIDVNIADNVGRTALLRRGGRAHDARVQPAGAEGSRLHAQQHGDHPDAAGARRQRECAAARGASLSHEARSRR